MGLSSCTITPGMRMNPTMRLKSVGYQVQICPTLIPIDVSLIQQMTLLAQNYYYLVGPRDVLEIYVWEHPEFNLPTGQEIRLNETTLEQNINGINGTLNPPIVPSGYLVGPDGNIFFPLVGSFSVAGKTVEQIRADLTNILAKYIYHPQINVRVSGFRSKKVYIMGEVVKPGLQPITDYPMSITDAINLAGGMDPNYADASHIYVIRGNYATPNVYWLNAKSPNAILLAENFRLQDHDVVFISSTDAGRFARVMNQILPTASTIWFATSVTH